MTVDEGGRDSMQGRSERREKVWKVARYCPERPYIELRVPGEIKTVYRIDFRILSHDQGNQA